MLPRRQWALELVRNEPALAGHRGAERIQNASNHIVELRFNHLQTTRTGLGFFILIEAPDLYGDAAVDEEIRRYIAVRLVDHVHEPAGC
jgi:hypothetical protein